MDVLGQDLKHRHDPTVVHIVSLLEWLPHLVSPLDARPRRYSRSTRIVSRPRPLWWPDGLRSSSTATYRGRREKIRAPAHHRGRYEPPTGLALSAVRPRTTCADLS